MARRSDGLYSRRGYWYFKFKAADGIWLEQAARTQNYADARKIRTDFLADLERGKLPNERARWTLRQAIHQRLVDRKYRLAPGSFASEAAIARTLLRVLGAEARLHRLADIENVRRYETVRLAEGISPKTVNNEIVVLAGVLREAKLWQRVDGDYKRLAVKKSDIPDALTREEAYRLIQLARTAGEDAVAPFAAVLSYATGMRSCEIKRPRIGAIHLDSEQPQLQVKRPTTKTNKGARYLALDTIAVWAIRKLLDRAAKLGASQSEHYLLPTRLDRHTRSSDPLHGGSGWDPSHPQTTWDEEWNGVRKQARIEHRRFPDLRHSYITRAAEAGVPVMVIQAQVGHMSAAMVEHYCHISQTAVHKAAELIEQQNLDLLGHLGLTSAGENRSQRRIGNALNSDAKATGESSRAMQEQSEVIQ